MRILFLGDIVGRAGRDAVRDALPPLRRRLAPDVVVACGENAAHGFGISPKICEDLFAAGVDVITLGNHAWDQRDIIPFIAKEPRLIRPANYPPGTPGAGSILMTDARGRRLLVVQVMGRLFMDPLDDPFAVVQREIAAAPLAGPPGRGAHAILVDMHAEATSEKMAIGHFLDGRVSAVVGGHTHVPTADAQILPGGTAYQSDAGMCGDYDSVIGMVKGPATERFVRKMPTERLSPAGGPATVCGILIETDDRTGLATAIAPVRIGGRLAATAPEFDSAGAAS
ncbi:TIGR00282 family metallophosphoesterase [Roseospira navarrensis]|uniref:Metallophosphoesterase n=1 Tax=Roseospira navarrensis TaxID=140058 RepID=A0A7X1ZFH9_9PROT|nr:TIGR00282 family metallophosphoesterase [Roseospira navarrensis]MQX37392.1 metallophosphoesterase [Roseospira navarrensis]